MLKFSDHFIARMKDHASRAYPEECCGFLLGSSSDGEKSVRDLLVLRNSSDELRTRRFMIRPDDYLEAETRSRELGMDVIGIYHSHPDHPAKPSQFDLDHALPWWSYVIIGVNRGTPVAMASWLLREDRSQFEEERVEIVDGKK